MTLIIFIFLGLGIIFNLAGTLGALIFPDVYTRLQTSSVCGTAAVFSVFIAAMLITGLSAMTGKILVIALFYLVSSPVSTHIVARYAWNGEMVPWKRPKLPALPEDDRR